MDALAGRRFRPSAIWALVAAVGIAATISLGNWQQGRAAEKSALAAKIARLADEPPVNVGRDRLEIEAVQHRRLEARGHFEPQHMILLDNRIRRGRAGYEVVMPLRIDGSGTRLLVSRGWIAGTGTRDRLPEVPTPSGEVHVLGRAIVPGLRIYELGVTTVEGNVWQNLTVDRYSQQTGLTVQPVLLQQESALQDGLLRDWPAPDTGVGTHKSYAFQWYALSVLILATYVVLSFRRDSTRA